MSLELFVGATGTGKTLAAVTKYPGAFRKLTGSKWWDGYDGQETVILDDYEGQIPYREFLQIIDHYWYLFEVKGGHVVKRWTRVVITSNVHPGAWYKDRYHVGEVERRFQEFGSIWLFQEDRACKISWDTMAKVL